MPCDFISLPHQGIQTLNPYQPGKSIAELASEQGIKDIIKLASNENPWGCSPLVKKALAAMSKASIASYPSPGLHPVHKKLCDKLGITREHLFLCNGSDLLFWLMLTTFALHTKKHLLIHEYAFMSYRIQAQTLGIPVKVTPLAPDWQVDIEALIKACTKDTALIFIANPNNPTGIHTPLDKIQHLLRNVPESTLVLIDEAYYEFAYAHNDPAALALLDEFPNLVVSRTFSKAYGLASLRLGYAIAHSQIIELLARIQPPFSVNQAALDAASAALDDEAFLQKTITMTAEGMQQMREGLQSLGLTLLPSKGNFITIDCGINALALYNDLLSHGIIVRPLHAYNLPNHLRVSIGTFEQNKRFLATFNSCLHNKKV